MQQVAGRHWQIGKWVPIAFDGSRTTAARTVSNEKEFCAPNYGRGKKARYRKRKSKGMRRRKNERNKPQSQHPPVWITLCCGTWVSAFLVRVELRAHIGKTWMWIAASLKPCGHSVPPCALPVAPPIRGF
jgi:hypothetical protein